MLVLEVVVGEVDILEQFVVELGTGGLRGHIFLVAVVLGDFVELEESFLLGISFH